MTPVAGPSTSLHRVIPPLRHPWVAFGLVCAAALVVFAAALQNGFAYDDVPAILGDPRVAGEAPTTQIFTRPYWSSQGAELGLYRPLVTLGFAFDWAVSGGHPGWFHAVNLLWNALASGLVFLLLLRFFPHGAAVAGAVLFAVHPVHTEAVANVVGRADIMAAAFVLAAALVWLRDRDPDGRPRRRGMAASALFFFCALLSKESAVMLPVLLVLLDFADGRWRAERGSVVAYLAKCRGGFLAMGVAGMVWIWARASALGSIVPTTLHPAAEVARGPLDLFRTALGAWPEYLRLLLFPMTLLADYGPRVLMPAPEWTSRAVLGATILVALLGGGVMAIARGQRRTALGLLWLPIAVLPASNLLIPIGTLVAERTLYLPSLAVAVVGAAVWQGAALSREAAPPLGARGSLVRAAVAVLMVFFAIRSATRVPDWRSTATIFAALEHDRPDSYRAGWYRARVAHEVSGAAAAHPLFMAAIETWPYRRGLIVEGIANAVEAGALVDARALARHAVNQWPADPETQRLLAATSLDLGDSVTAARAVAAGLQLKPDDEMLRAMQAALGRER